MSLLLNPSFEEQSSTAPWTRCNMADAVDLSLVTNQDDAASGRNYLRFRTAVGSGSVAQDVQVAMPSITATAFVRAQVGQVAGTLAIWDLNASRNVTVGFTVGTTWVPVTAMLALGGTSPRPVRVELYLGTTNVYLLVDSVNAY